MANDFFYKKVEAYKKAKTFIIYEGLGRMSIKERIHFLEIAYGSLTEVTCQLDIAQSLGYITDEELKTAEDMSIEVGRIMSGLRKSLIDKQNNCY